MPFRGFDRVCACGRQWKHALERRGQRRRLSWERLGKCSWFELPFARNLHPTV
jgi:hypothetical protein